MKIYTRTGDDGTTALFGGPRVPKNHVRVAAYGSIDEVNASLAVCRANEMLQLDCAIDLAHQLTQLQSMLFEIGAILATPAPAPAAARDKSGQITPADIARIESWIDAAEEQVSPLTTFVLPGGCTLSASLHVARTVCRRAERDILTLFEEKTTDERILPVLQFTNRLSDLLFVWARLANVFAKTPDIPWLPRSSQEGQPKNERP